MKERQEGSIVHREILKVAKECDIDPNELNRDMQSFFDRRSLADAIKNQDKNVCSITQRTMKFLKNEQGEIEKKSCTHFNSEEDDQIKYIHEY